MDKLGEKIDRKLEELSTCPRCGHSAEFGVPGDGCTDGRCSCRANR